MYNIICSIVFDLRDCFCRGPRIEYIPQPYLVCLSRNQSHKSRVHAYERMTRWPTQIHDKEGDFSAGFPALVMKSSVLAEITPVPSDYRGNAERTDWFNTVLLCLSDDFDISKIMSLRLACSRITERERCARVEEVGGTPLPQFAVPQFQSRKDNHFDGNMVLLRIKNIYTFTVVVLVAIL